MKSLHQAAAVAATATEGPGSGNDTLIDSLELDGSGGGVSSCSLAVARINPAQAVQRLHKHITTLSGRMCTVLKPLVMKQTLVTK